MKEPRNFDSILDECLEQILTHGATVEQCLQQHPELADELEPLLNTVAATREAVAVEPSREFRQRASVAFQHAISEMQNKKASSPVFGWLPQWAAVAAAVIVLLVGGGGGTVLASANSMPDEPLYGVKIFSEKAQVFFTPSEMAKAELYVQFADKRTAEITEMAKEGKAMEVVKAAEIMNGQLVAMAAAFAPEQTEAAMLQAPAAAPAPGPAGSASQPSEEAPGIAALEAPPETLAEDPKLTTAETPPPPAIREVQKVPDSREEPAAPKDLTEEEVDRYLKMKVELLRGAIENPERLREILETVPESARPALLRAIELSYEGYRLAVESLPSQ